MRPREAYLSSTSVAAPTLMTAAPPASLARRPGAAVVKSEVVFSISALIWAMRSSIALEPAPPTMVVSLENLGRTLGATEHLALTSLEVNAEPLMTAWPPVTAILRVRYDGRRMVEF